MSDPNQPSTPPGWYPDGQGGQRWWDGSQWTEHTQPPTGDTPAAPEAPAAPAAPAGSGAPGGDLPTQVAPNRASNYPAGQQVTPPQPQQPQQGVYGAPAGSGGFGQPAGQPGQQPFGGFPASSGGSGGGKGKLIAIIGGAVGALILLVIAIFVVLSLVGGGSPEDVAGDYLEANGDGDAEKSCELSSEDHRQAVFGGDDCGKVEDALAEDFEDQGIPGYEDYEDLLDDIDYEFEIGDVSEKEKTATVEYTYSIEYTGDEEGFDIFNQEDVEAELELVKEDGDWKVDSDSGDF